MLRKLLRRGVSAVSAVSADGLSAIGLAVVCGQQGALALLVDHQVDPTVVDREGQTLIHLAAKRTAQLAASRREGGSVVEVHAVFNCLQVVLERVRLALLADHVGLWTVSIPRVQRIDNVHALHDAAEGDDAGIVQLVVVVVVD